MEEGEGNGFGGEEGEAEKESISFEEAIAAVCRWYGYRLEDFYIKSFLQGGLTYNQIIGLYEYKLKEDEEHLRFQAAIHGAKLKETGRAFSSEDNLNATVPMFGDPKEYESLSQEEREEMTKKMMGKHKLWAGTASPYVGAKD